MSLFSQEVPISWYLLLSAVLFSLGVVGFSDQAESDYCLHVD